MKDKLRELAERWQEYGAEYAIVSDQGDVTWHTCADELLAILDAEGDGGAVAVQTRYQGPNKTVNTDWRPCSFAHAQAVKDARCDVTEIRYLYTNPARSGVVSEEDVEAARSAFVAADDGSTGITEAMRAALESYERSRK